MRRFNVVACGRRFGKSVLSQERLLRPALEGFPTAYFCPTYKMLGMVWREVKNTLHPVTAKVNEQEHRVELVTGGSVDFWSLDNPDSARGRKYKRAEIDEAAMVRDLEGAWYNVIRPTLADFRGGADFLSTPRGRNFFWRAYTFGQDEAQPEWACWQMPTTANPFIHPDEVEAARLQLPERSFRQEFLAEFIEDSGGVFRKVNEAVDPGRVAPDDPRPNDSYVTGVDLARTEDFTVVCVLDGNGRQAYFERFNQITWERQIGAIRAAAARYPGPVVFDATSMGGDMIHEAFRNAGVRVVPYTFTNKTKEQAVNKLAMRLEQGCLRLMDVPAQTNELLSFEYELTASRNVRMNAPAGMHDDCVMALSLATWGLDRFAAVAETPEQAAAREEAERAARDEAQRAWLDPMNEALWS